MSAIRFGGYRTRLTALPKKSRGGFPQGDPPLF